jgi:hypothetical protein
MQVRPPCNYVTNAMSSWYGPCVKDAMGVDLSNMVFDKIGDGGSGDTAGAHDFGCVRGTKKIFLVLLAGNSPVQSLVPVL